MGWKGKGSEFFSLGTQLRGFVPFSPLIEGHARVFAIAYCCPDLDASAIFSFFFFSLRKEHAALRDDSTRYAPPEPLRAYRYVYIYTYTYNILTRKVVAFVKLGV